MRVRLPIPEEIEEYRDSRWRREGTRQVESAYEAEHFIEQTGFAACMTDSRRPGPSLYVAVCGRRDAVMPRNVQKDPEASLTWHLKDELVRRGKVYYAKLSRGKTMFLAPRMIPYFHAIWGVRRAEEQRRLSRDARAILKVLRGEWEMGTADLREASGVRDRHKFTKGMDELQAAMLVVPSQVFYKPKFTYIWTLGVGRFPDALRRRIGRATAVREIARGFLAGAGMTIPGELARVIGVSRPEAGRGNRALVAEGYATMLARGVYRLNGVEFPESGNRAADPFELVKSMALAMPDVEAATKYDGSPALEVRGVFMAGLPMDPSAERDTLVVRYPLEERGWLLEEAPETYYVTDYHRDKPVVLVRLSEIGRDALRDLLSVSWRLACEKAKVRS